MGGGGPFVDAEDAGLCGRFTVFLRLATEELKLGALSLFGAPGRGGAAAGGLGADDVGGLGAEELLDDSGSDVEDDSRFARKVNKYSQSADLPFLTSSINTSTTLLQFWHASSKYACQLWRLFHS